MKRSLVALGLLAPLTGNCLGLCLNPFGCEPKTYDECVSDAASKPTEVGVKIANQVCYNRFQRAVDEAAARKAAADAETFASNWADLRNKASTISEVVKLLGAPTYTSGPAPCSPLDGIQKTSKCNTYYWIDPRPHRLCLHSTVCEFQLEAVADSDGLLWAWWPNPK